MMATRRTFGVLCVALQLAGCAGSGDGLDANGRPLAEGGGGGVLTPDITSIQANVFTPVCTQCHTGANAPQGLRLDAANSYGALVGVASSEVPALQRVKPGDPAASYLIQKLEGSAAVGARMPLNQPALPAATIAVIRQWIASGAPRAAMAQGKPLAVETVSASPAAIAVALNRPVDASLVNQTTVMLRRLDPAADAPVVTMQPVVSPVNDSLIVLDLPTALPAGRYELTLRGTGAAALADLNAALIDGNQDGVPGGDYVTVLTLGEAP